MSKSFEITANGGERAFGLPGGALLLGLVLIIAPRGAAMEPAI